ncbi:MAG: hypothetical protein ABJE10_08415 [bacterium]
MITTRTNVLARLAATGAVLLAAQACTEPVANKAVAAPEQTLEARLLLSDSLPAVGATVDVFAQVTAAMPEMIGSYTARIRYDTTALRYDREIAIADDALRATNPTGGVLRFAGAAPNGLASGRLAGYRFVVLSSNAMQSLQLVVDEMHTVTRTDAASRVRAMPARAGVAP